MTAFDGRADLVGHAGIQKVIAFDADAHTAHAALYAGCCKSGTSARAEFDVLRDRIRQSRPSMSALSSTVRVMGPT